MIAATESPPKEEEAKTSNAQRPTPNVELRGNANGAAPPPQIQNVPLGEILRSPFNREVDTKTPEFAELVESIRIHGVIQPGLARPLPDALDLKRKPGTPRLELVIGEHRWLGSQAAKRATMPLMVRQLTDVEVVELQTIENDKRKDLSPIEKAEKYQQLIDQYVKGGTNKEAAIAKLCEKLSLGKSTVYEALRLLQLPAEAKAAVKSGKLPPSHAGLIVKLPAAAQAAFSKLIAPGKRMTYGDEQKLERELGVDFDLDGERDEETGLMAFRDVKELVDTELRNIERAAKYEIKAAEFRKKGGVALTWDEARKEARDLLTANDYLAGFSSYVNQLTKGVKDLPKLIMRPLQHDPAQPEMVYRRSEIEAALKKAGVKSRSGGTSMADYNRRERDRQARQRIKKAVLEATIDPIRAAAGKRNAKIPWLLFVVAMAGWTASRICSRRGWKANYQNASKVLGEHLAKMPENQMAGLVVDILIEKVATAHTGSYQPEFVQLGNFYGVDVKAIAEAAPAKLAPEPEKKVHAKGAKGAKGKVQASGKTAKAKGKGLSAGTRAKLAASANARAAATKKAKAKK